MENSLAKRLLSMIDSELKCTQYEMKEIDRLYISKQKQVRQLKKAKVELELQIASETLPF